MYVYLCGVWVLGLVCDFFFWRRVWWYCGNVVDDCGVCFLYVAVRLSRRLNDVQKCLNRIQQFQAHRIGCRRFRHDRHRQSLDHDCRSDWTDRHGRQLVHCHGVRLRSRPVVLPHRRHCAKFRHWHQRHVVHYRRPAAIQGCHRRPTRCVRGHGLGRPVRMVRCPCVAVSSSPPRSARCRPLSCHCNRWARRIQKKKQQHKLAKPHNHTSIAILLGCSGNFAQPSGRRKWWRHSWEWTERQASSWCAARRRCQICWRWSSTHPRWPDWVHCPGTAGSRRRTPARCSADDRWALTKI